MLGGGLAAAAGHVARPTKTLLRMDTRAMFARLVDPTCQLALLLAAVVIPAVHWLLHRAVFTVRRRRPPPLFQNEENVSVLTRAE